MKKGLVGLLLAVTLGLAGCDNDNSESISTPAGGAWSESAKNIMKEVIGEELPFVELKADYVCTKETDDSGDYVQIYDEDSVNHLVNYGDTLTSNGYTYDSESSDEDITVYFYVKDDIVVQYGFSADEGNTIFAWIETPTAQTTDTAWPSDLSALMNTLLNEELPFVALAENYEYESNQIYIYDTSNVNYLENYSATLVANGYELAYKDESYGYPIYEYVKYLSINSIIVVDFDYYPGDEYNDPCNEIAARLSHLTASWPNEAIADIIGDEYSAKVPEFSVTSGYEYYNSTDAITIVGEVSEDISTSYANSAKENGLLMGVGIDWNTWDYYEYLYDWEENFEVAMSSSFEDNATSGYFSITISRSEKTYDSLESAFPTAAIATFLGEVTTEVPSFAIAEGNTYKVTSEEANELFGTPACLSILAIDNGTIGTDSLEDTYKTTVTNAGYTVDNSQYEDYGYIATSADQKVSLNFYTDSGVFYLYISLAE